MDDKRYVVPLVGTYDGSSKFMTGDGYPANVSQFRIKLNGGLFKDVDVRFNKDHLLCKQEPDVQYVVSVIEFGTVQSSCVYGHTLNNFVPVDMFKGLKGKGFYVKCLYMDSVAECKARADTILYKVRGSLFGSPKYLYFKGKLHQFEAASPATKDAVSIYYDFEASAFVLIRMVTLKNVKICYRYWLKSDGVYMRVGNMLQFMGAYLDSRAVIF